MSRYAFCGMNRLDTTAAHGIIY